MTLKNARLACSIRQRAFRNFASYAGQAANAETSVKKAPNRINRINVMLEAAVPSAEEALRNAGASGMPLESVEKELRQAEVDLSDAQANYTSWSDKQSQHALLSQKLRDTQARHRLISGLKIRLELAAESTADTYAVVTEVKRLFAACRAEQMQGGTGLIQTAAGGL